MSEMSEPRVSADFALIVAAAIAGERCPLSEPFGPIRPQSISFLIKAGRIRSEVYSRNYRVIVIIDGPHKGKATAPPPQGQPYLVNGVHVDRIARRTARIAP